MNGDCATDSRPEPPHRTTDAFDGLIAVTYDARGHETAVTVPRGLTTLYTSMTWTFSSGSSPDTGIATYTCDVAGNRTSWRMPKM